MSTYSQVNKPLLRPPVERGLRALVGVLHEPDSRSAACDGHLECVDDELGLEVGAHRPADDATAVAVDDRGQVEPALPAAHVLDVGDPELVRSAWVEVALDQVAGDANAGHTDRRAPEALRHQPESPRMRISRSTRLRPTRTPRWRSAAWTRRAP